MSELPTVKISRADNPRGGFAIINEADFDPKRHELFDAQPAGTPLTAEEAAAAASSVLSMADGNFMAFKAAAKKLLGDACPAKKGDIVAALMELATKP